MIRANLAIDRLSYPSLIHARADGVSMARIRFQRARDWFERRKARDALLVEIARGVEGCLRASAIDARQSQDGATRLGPEGESATRRGTPK